MLTIDDIPSPEALEESAKILRHLDKQEQLLCQKLASDRNGVYLFEDNYVTVPDFMIRFRDKFIEVVFDYTKKEFEAYKQQQLEKIIGLLNGTD